MSISPIPNENLPDCRPGWSDLLDVVAAFHGWLQHEQPDRAAMPPGGMTVAVGHGLQAHLDITYPDTLLPIANCIVLGIAEQLVLPKWSEHAVPFNAPELARLDDLMDEYGWTVLETWSGAAQDAVWRYHRIGLHQRMSNSLAATIGRSLTTTNAAIPPDIPGGSMYVSDAVVHLSMSGPAAETLTESQRHSLRIDYSQLDVEDLRGRCIELGYRPSNLAHMTKDDLISFFVAMCGWADRLYGPNWENRRRRSEDRRAELVTTLDDTAPIPETSTRPDVRSILLATGEWEPAPWEPGIGSRLLRPIRQPAAGRVVIGVSKRDVWALFVRNSVESPNPIRFPRHTPATDIAAAAEEARLQAMSRNTRPA